MIRTALQLFRNELNKLLNYFFFLLLMNFLLYSSFFLIKNFIFL